jgi:anti-sigma B factor antagonist
MIDLSAVTYIDSSGVASLVEGYQTAKKQNLKFGLVGVSKAVLSVLQLARLDKVFPIHSSMAECINSNK